MVRCTKPRVLLFYFFRAKNWTPEVIQPPVSPTCMIMVTFVDSEVIRAMSHSSVVQALSCASELDCKFHCCNRTVYVIPWTPHSSAILHQFWLRFSALIIILEMPFSEHWFSPWYTEMIWSQGFFYFALSFYPSFITWSSSNFRPQ